MVGSNGRRFKVTFMSKRNTIVANARGEFLKKGKRVTPKRNFSSFEVRVLNSDPNIKLISVKEVRLGRTVKRKTAKKKARRKRR